MKISTHVIAVVFAYTASTAALACELDTSGDTQQVAGSHHILSYRSAPSNISVSEPFSLVIRVCENSGQPFSGSLSADAHMPMHKHGMNYRPKITPLREGEFQAEGFLFHMPGHWQFILNIENGAKSEQITLDQKI